MNILLFLLALYIMKCEARPIAKLKKQKANKIDSFDDAMQFLGNFGYMKPSIARNGLINAKELKKILLHYQRFMGIHETGKLDDETMSMMNQPRCGVADFDPFAGKNRVRRYALHGSSWDKRELTWKVEAYSNQPKVRGRHSEIDDVFRRAFKVWSSSSTLKFIHTPHSPNSNIMIKFASKEHGDSSPFDGPGITLAHAFYPDAGGNAHFDDDEDWSFVANQGVDLLSVAVHEFGHSLGLRHSDVKGSIMYPAYGGKKDALTSDDITAINMIYPENTGRSIEVATQSNRPRVLSIDTRTAMRKMCENFTVDAITCSLDGDCYLFSGEYIWTLKRGSRVFETVPNLVSEMFPFFTGKIDAAVTDVDGIMFLFQGPRVKKYLGIRRPPLHEALIRDVFIGLNVDKIDAALKWGRNGKLYFFKDKIYWRYEKSKVPPIDLDYPKPITTWDGLPNASIDAAFQLLSTGKTYFFKGDFYWRFNDTELKVDEHLRAPFPRESTKWWMGCGEKSF